MKNRNPNRTYKVVNGTTQAFWQGKTVKEWAEIKGVKTRCIIEHLNKYGTLKNVTQKKESPKYKGKTYTQWADIYGVHWNTIDGHIRKHGHLNKIRPKTAKEIEKWNKHHRPEKIIHKNFYKGKPLRQWARELGVSYDRVNNHVKIYGHLNNIHLSTKELTQLAVQKRKLTKLQKELQQHEESVEYFNQ